MHIEEDVLITNETRIMSLMCPKCKDMMEKLLSARVSVRWTGDTTFSVSAGKEPSK